MVSPVSYFQFHKDFQPGFPHDIKTGALISADLLFLAISTTLVPGYLINSQYFSKAI